MREMGERRRYKKRHSSDNLLNRSEGRIHRQLARRSTFYLSESFKKITVTIGPHRDEEFSAVQIISILFNSDIFSDF